ncbi:ABC transporter permease [Bradyrhizobium diazoefficiens]|nr:ABC transporter permease [Bradyrhizobium diazoefficiens]MBR0704816.1 ABC transporter permease [Bradyrhizobium diazoefficiens]MBR0773165.1 ABC transporter permease [Bradyrhizobium diazoefficiens]
MRKQRDQQLLRTIVPPPTWPSIDFCEAFRARRLLGIFVRRDLSSRYRQMALGVAWALLEPLGQLLLISVVFGYVIKVPTNGYPYPVFVFAALIPWLLMSKSVQSAAGSVLDNISIVTKVAFPRIILPFSAVTKELFDSAILFAILLLLSAFWGFYPSLRMLIFVPLFLFIVLLALSIGAAFATLSVKYRDLRPMISLGLNVGYYGTPILYPASLIPASVLPYVQLNPMFWVVEFARWAILNHSVQITASLYWSFALTLALLLGGLTLFARFEREIADVY